MKTQMFILFLLSAASAGADTYNFYFDKNKKPAEGESEVTAPAETDAKKAREENRQPPITINNNNTVTAPPSVEVLPAHAPAAVIGNGVMPVGAPPVEGKETFFRFHLGTGYAASRRSMYASAVGALGATANVGVQNNRYGVGMNVFTTFLLESGTAQPIFGGLELEYIPLRSEDGDLASFGGFALLKSGSGIEVEPHIGIRGTVYLSKVIGIQAALRASRYFLVADGGITLRL